MTCQEQTSKNLRQSAGMRIKGRETLIKLNVIIDEAQQDVSDKSLCTCLA